MHMHILFAEDSRAMAAPTIDYLSQQGHLVTHVLNGREAVDSFAIMKPDLVLMDVTMPEMDGIEATRRIKALDMNRWVPVMLLTALTGKKEIIAGLEAGADDYLLKPIDPEILAAKIRSIRRIAKIQDSLLGILDNVFEAIITIDENGLMQSFNKAAERIFGYSSAEVVGRNVKYLMPKPYSVEHDEYIARYLVEGKPHVIGTGRKVHGLRKNGEIFPIRLAVTEIRRNNQSQFIGLVSDISQEELARERIEFLALHDPLTHLPNRAYFNETFERLCSNPNGKIHALIYIDLDGFKPINDTLGHDAGDETLKIIADRLKRCMAVDDFVARLGGDEFVVIATDIQASEVATNIGNRLLEVISRPLVLMGNPMRIGASIGVVIVPGHGMAANKVLTAADNAMYAAKNAGKNRCVFVAATDDCWNSR